MDEDDVSDEWKAWDTFGRDAIAQMIQGKDDADIYDFEHPRVKEIDCKGGGFFYDKERESGLEYEA